MKKWLVAITFKDVTNKPDSGVIEYYEVEAKDERFAKLYASMMFKKDYIYKPWIKRFMSQWKTVLSDTEPADAVEI